MMKLPSVPTRLLLSLVVVIMTMIMTTTHRHVLLVDAADTGSSGTLLRRTTTTTNGPPYCGCQDCTDDIWNLSVKSNDGGEYTCGERITWVHANIPGMSSQEDACQVIAAKEFPAECGKACNPLRCDGRNVPYEILPQDNQPIVAGELTADSDMYCFPSAANRQTWNNVWDSNFVLQVKESPVVCAPGNNLFTQDTVSFDAANEELKLEFFKKNGLWMGAEVRLALPDDKTPFHYGTYEWSIKSIHVIDDDTDTVVGWKLPPRLVLGLFTWDTTEDYAIRENRNHEVDIEISQFGDIGGPDVNFLVQPPGRPQQAKLYSGGSAGVFDQSGPDTYKFDWNPNNITWYSSTGGGLSHVYSSDIILDYASPPWLQCLPADVEVRMNLWSLDGVNNQLELQDNQRIEVIIDRFTYTPSGETHVANGGSCSKHCQCSVNSECDAGTCRALSTSAATTTTTATETTTTTATTTSTTVAASPEVSAACSAHPDCNGLAGNCCPTIDGVFLYCCSNDGQSPPVTTASPPGNTGRACSAHPACSHLAGMCCPTVGPNSAMLYCCGN